MAFLCLLELELHLPDNVDLKGKRKELQSLKAQLRRRFGAAVAETEHHDLWQRATIAAALVAGERRGLEENADALQRFVDGRFGDWVTWERMVVSTGELKEG
ncbi:MAG TPA: DUF503 domain-containing protein [Thermoleophilaceae bacterium]|nr:DUF503 domain-containing protein [Thermoleophilaceae bacterium]